MKSTVTVDEFIQAHRLDDNVFATGIFYPGITIYNQQIRTLNLIHFLHSKKLLNNRNPIIVIGGGISGVTAAVALNHLNYDVNLLEQKSILIHLQHGSTTRKIHPNLYDWPATNSTRPYTELPFLNWKYSDAAILERTLISELSRHRDSRTKKLNVYYSVRNQQSHIPILNLKKKEVRFSHSYPGDPVKNRSETFSFSSILIATGFGLEQYVGRREQTVSYWRNEDYAQLRLADQIRRFFVSGTGDGGITDVCRLRLVAFDPLYWANRFLRLRNRSGEILGRDIEKLYKKTLLDKTRLFDGFEKIEGKYGKGLERIINEHRRKDIDEVILNGTADFKTIIQGGRMSFLNAWLLYLLKKYELIQYVKGNFPGDCGDYLFPKDDNTEYKVIVRHGTNRDLTSLNSIYDGLAGQLTSLKSKQNSFQLNLFSIKPQWQPDDWFPDGAKYYEISDRLIRVTTSFLSAIQGVISSWTSRNKLEAEYRITMHRLNSYNGEYYFQQMTEYFQNQGAKTKKKTIGRLFPLSQGVVGLAMRSCTPFYLLTKNNSTGMLFNFDKIHARKLNPGTSSFLIIPVLPKTINVGNMCFYLDTNKSELVEDLEIRSTIYGMLKGFAEHISVLNVNQEHISKEMVKKIDTSDDEDLFAEYPIKKLQTELRDIIGQGKIQLDSDHLVEVYSNEL